jgi:osmotically-inducible protein OsmY
MFTALVITLVGCAGASATVGAGEYIDDGDITTKVKSAFFTDARVGALDITVTTFKGTVQLSGHANSPQEISRAIELARNVTGVKAVENAIQLV